MESKNLQGGDPPSEPHQSRNSPEMNPDLAAQTHLQVTHSVNSDIGTTAGLVATLEVLVQGDKGRNSAKEAVMREIEEIRLLLPKTVLKWPERVKLLRPILEAAEEYLIEPTADNAAEFRMMAEGLIVMLKKRK